MIVGTYTPDRGYKGPQREHCTDIRGKPRLRWLSDVEAIGLALVGDRLRGTEVGKLRLRPYMGCDGPSQEVSKTLYSS